MLYCECVRSLQRSALETPRLSGVALCKGLDTAPQVVNKDRTNGETAGGNGRTGQPVAVLAIPLATMGLTLLQGQPNCPWSGRPLVVLGLW
eukprot:scaffold27600_cov51-Phaeocystis_antarctica.AAC.2